MDLTRQTIIESIKESATERAIQDATNGSTQTVCSRLCLYATLLCLALLTNVATAESSPTLNTSISRFNHLTVEDGLSQGSVNAITQDRTGFIWIGTQQGLNRYDGVTFRAYLKDDANPRSLSSNWIWDLYQDKEQRLWVATLGGGLLRYDAQTDDFERLAIPVTTIRAVASGPTGRLWLAAENEGLVQYDPVSGAVHTITPSELHVDTDRVLSLHWDAYGSLWVGTRGAGLFRYNPVSDTFHQVAGTTGLSVNSISGGATNDLWVGTEDSGLLVIDAASRELTQHFQSETTALSSNRIRALLVDDRQRIWIGHDFSGANLIEAGKISEVGNDYVAAGSLADNHVRALFEDRDGLIWIGTQRGISIWNPRSSQFKNFVRQKHGRQGISDNWISGFAEHTPNQSWVATYGGGLNLVNLDTGEVETFRHDPDDANSVSDDRVMALAGTPEGNLWLGTRANGVDFYQPHSGQWQHFRHDPDNANSLSSNLIPSLLLEGRILWIGTMGGGLNRLDLDTMQFTHYRHDPDDPASICSDRVMHLYLDRKQQLWIGSLKDGMCRMDRSSGTFTWFRHTPEDPTSLTSDASWLVTEDAFGNLWVGSENNGLSVWLAADRAADRVRFHRLTTDEGLVSNVVYGMLADNLGRIWIGSNKGLTRYQPSFDDRALVVDQQFHYTTDDGLPGNEFNFAAAALQSTDMMLFGGTSGFTVFNPSLEVEPIAEPVIALTGFQRLGQAVRVTPNQPEFDIEFADKVIRFDYAALSYHAPAKIRYQHKLEGFDQEWVDDGYESRATYTNLDPGEYLFRVRAAHHTGQWGAQELTVPLRVANPIWSTPQAHASDAVAVVLLCVLVYMAWMRRVHIARNFANMNAALLAEADRRASKEAALASQQQRTQLYLDVVEVLIIALDSQGRIEMINQKGARVLGQSEEDLKGRYFVDEFVPEEERNGVRQNLRQVEKHTYSESNVVSHDGSQRLIAWHNIQLPDRNGAVLLSGSDVTQMRKLETRLREGQTMEALGTLARGVAHDFNNVLSAILGYSELAKTQLKGGSSPTSTQAPLEYLGKLEGSVERAKDLIKNILAFSRAQDVPMEVINLSEVTFKSLELVRPLVPDNVHMLEQIEPECGPIHANTGQIIQVILNLCTNAFQSMAGTGGKLKISLRTLQPEQLSGRNVSALHTGPHIELAIEDTGAGIDDLTLSRIFEPFFTTRLPGEGSGLGLAVVQSVISRLHGTIEVDSEVGFGTRFSILLPQADSAIPIAFAANPAPAKLAGRETVLLADDEATLTEIVENTLASNGYTVLIARDGEEALARLHDQTQPIDALITDQTMPGMRGEEIARRAKQLRPGLPVLLISGADAPEVDWVDDFLEKPFSQDILAQRLRQLLDARDLTEV